MSFQPETARPSAGRLIAIAVVIALLLAVYLWSLRSGRERVLDPPEPTGGAASTVVPGGPPVGPVRP
jgi:hypothetical protein